MLAIWQYWVFLRILFSWKAGHFNRPLVKSGWSIASILKKIFEDIKVSCLEMQAKLQ